MQPVDVLRKTIPHAQLGGGEKHRTQACKDALPKIYSNARMQYHSPRCTTAVEERLTKTHLTYPGYRANQAVRRAHTFVSEILSLLYIHASFQDEPQEITSCARSWYSKVVIIGIYRSPGSQVYGISSVKTCAIPRASVSRVLHHVSCIRLEMSCWQRFPLMTATHAVYTNNL